MLNKHYSPIGMPLMALLKLLKGLLLEGALERFKRRFIRWGQPGSIWLWQIAIKHNKLAFVQFLLPFVRDDLDNDERKWALGEEEEEEEEEEEDEE